MRTPDEFPVHVCPAGGGGRMEQRTPFTLLAPIPLSIIGAFCSRHPTRKAEDR